MELVPHPCLPRRTGQEGTVRRRVTLGHPHSPRSTGRLGYRFLVRSCSEDPASGSPTPVMTKHAYGWCGELPADPPGHLRGTASRRRRERRTGIHRGANRGRVARTPRRRVGRGRSPADRRRPERTPPRRYEQTPGGNASSPGAAALPPTSRTADGLAWPATGFRQTGRQSADVAFACRCSLRRLLKTVAALRGCGWTED